MVYPGPDGNAIYARFFALPHFVKSCFHFCNWTSEATYPLSSLFLLFSCVLLKCFLFVYQWQRFTVHRQLQENYTGVETTGLTIANKNQPKRVLPNKWPNYQINLLSLCFICPFGKLLVNCLIYIYKSIRKIWVKRKVNWILEVQLKVH